MRSPLRALAQPSAIWLRQELPVQRKRTRSLCVVGMGQVPLARLRGAGVQQARGPQQSVQLSGAWAMQASMASAIVRREAARST